MSQSLQVVIIKPSKYLADGCVERFRRGFLTEGYSKTFRTRSAN